LRENASDDQLPDFSCLELTGAFLAYANLSGLCLNNSDLFSCDFRQANLENTDLSGADLYFCDFSKHYEMIEMMRGYYPEFPPEQKIAGTVLRNANLQGADLRYADFRGADLDSADMTGADLRYARFDDSVLRNANLTNADLRDASFTGACLTGAQFNRTVVQNAILENIAIELPLNGSVIGIPNQSSSGVATDSSRKTKHVLASFDAIRIDQGREQKRGEDATRNRIGLVLEGGGAKGAYQFGVLRAFKKLGIEFHAVAGTSVGSLNAALWSTDQIPLGRKIWFDLHKNCIFPWNVSPVIGWFLIFPVFLLNLCSAFELGTLPDDVDRWMARCLRTLHGLLTIGGGCCLVFAIYMSQGLPVLVPGIVFLGVLILWFLSGRAKRRALLLLCAVTTPVLCTFASQWLLSHEIVARIVFALISLYLAVVLYLGVRDWLANPMFFSNGSHGDLKIVLQWSQRLGPAILVTAILVISGQWIVDVRWAPATRLSVGIGAACVGVFIYLGLRGYLQTVGVFTNTPLLQLVWKIAMADVKVPSYATVTVRDKRGNPKVRYCSFKDSSIEEKSLVLVASCALPYGLVAPIKVLDEVWVDGGIVDNAPYYPLIMEAKCEKLVFVLHDRNSTGQDPGRWSTLHGRVDLAKRREVDSDNWMYWNYLLEKLACCRDAPRPPNWPQSQPLIIAPRESVGGFLSGTLNFSSGYARRLMKLGFEDGLRAESELRALFDESA